jgi:hypothetical protein
MRTPYAADRDRQADAKLWRWSLPGNESGATRRIRSLTRKKCRWRERSLSWKHMTIVNAAAASGVVRPASSVRLGSQVLIAMGVAITCTVLLTLLMTVQQLSMSMGDQTPRIPMPSVFVRGLIFYSPWVVLAPAITLLGWYQRLGTGNLAWRVPVWIKALVIACVVDPLIMVVSG